MYSLLNLTIVVEIKGRAKTLFGTKEVAPRRVYNLGQKIILTKQIEEEIANYEKKAINDVNRQLKEESTIQDEYWASCKTYKMKEIESIKIIKSPFVEKLESISYEDLAKIANIKELLLIEEYYKERIR